MSVAHAAQVTYTFQVVATLAFIEKEHSEDGLALDAPMLAEEEESGHIKHNTAITSGIRNTTRYLQSVGGIQALWRGLSCAVSIQFVFGIAASLMTGALKVITFGKVPYLDHLLGSLAAAILLSHWRTAWTHIVISNPSPRSWLSRVPPFRLTVQNVWLATLVHELASRIAFLLPMGVFFALGLNNPEQSAGAIIGKSIPVVVLAIVLYIVLAIPATVALARVQASMLPDEDETIVPFDRSFEGKVDPAIVGGSGAVSFMDAWKSLTRQARNRIVKLLIKMILIVTGMYLVAGSVIAVELAAFLQNAPKVDPVVL